METKNRVRLVLRLQEHLVWEEVRLCFHASLFMRGTCTFMGPSTKLAKPRGLFVFPAKLYLCFIWGDIWMSLFAGGMAPSDVKAGGLLRDVFAPFPRQTSDRGARAASHQPSPLCRPPGPSSDVSERLYFGR